MLLIGRLALSLTLATSGSGFLRARGGIRRLCVGSRERGDEVRVEKERAVALARRERVDEPSRLFARLRVERHVFVAQKRNFRTERKALRRVHKVGEGPSFARFEPFAIDGERPAERVERRGRRVDGVRLPRDQRGGGYADRVAKRRTRIPEREPQFSYARPDRRGAARRVDADFRRDGISVSLFRPFVRRV